MAKSVQMSVRFPNDLWELIHKEAEKNMRSFANQLMVMLRTMKRKES